MSAFLIKDKFSSHLHAFIAAKDTFVDNNNKHNINVI